MSPISFSPSTLLIHVSLKIWGGGRKKIIKKMSEKKMSVVPYSLF